MKNTFVKIGGILPKILENTTLSLSLSGWPAAIAIGFVCVAGVVCYAIHEGAKQVDAGQPETEQSEAEQAEARQPEAGQVEARQPEAGQVEARQPEAEQAEARELEAEQAETGKSEAEFDCLVRLSDPAA